MVTFDWARARHSRPRQAYRLAIEALEDRCLLSGDMVLRWNDVMLGAIRTAGQSPLVATRTGAIVQAAVYEAVNAIDQTHTPYLVNIPAPSTASQGAATAQAAHDTLVSIFPTQATALGLQLRASLQGIENGEAKTWGIRVGRAAAQILLAVRRHDGASRVVDYTPGTNPGDWQPTPPAFAPPAGPQWPYITPFAISSASQYRPDGPPALASAEYAADFNQVKSVGSLDSATRTADQTEAALFWQGIVTPHGGAVENFNSIAHIVAESYGTSLAENARMFALLNLAQGDAAIACWDAKYTYDFWRPVTAIRAADTDDNPDTEADPTWTPLIATPAHPSYTSAHSCISGAAATNLANFFGTDEISFSYSWGGLPGVTRSFTSFSGAVEEVALSRLWAGIHYYFDNTTGLTIGQSVATHVFENYLLPLAGPGGSPGGSTGNRLQAAPDIVSLLTANPGERIHALAGISVLPNRVANEIALVIPGGTETAAWLRPTASVLPDSPNSELVDVLFDDFAAAAWLT